MITLCVLQYNTEGNFMLKNFFINSVFFIRVKDWSVHTFSNAVLEIGLQIGLKFRVCLYDRLGTWTAKADYFSLKLTQANAPYAWPGPGPQCPSAVLSYPVKGNRFRVWLRHCPGWTWAAFAWGSTLQLLGLSTQPCSPFTSALLHPCSWNSQWVSCLPPCLPPCAAHQATLSRHRSVWKNLSSQGSSHPSQSSHVDFSTKTTRACWSGSRGAMRMI